MYSGLVLTKYSGRLMGAHQKIDRVARRHVGELLPKNEVFPSIGNVLKFEGKNGPDGIKRKSPAKDEPWHFLNPLGDDHDEFLQIIAGHYTELVTYLNQGNTERAAFEAAWLAHAVVDGLTPAHHYPYEEKVAELRKDGGNQSRNTIAKKLIFQGDTAAETVKNTYKVYGPKGLLTSHVLFELGFMFIIRPLRFPDARPNDAEIAEALQLSPEEFFMRRAREVAVLDYFERYLDKGWTRKLSSDVRHQLAPLMVRTVTLLWYKACEDANLCE